MKRNMNIVRELLIKIEENGIDDTYYTDNQEECYHLQIMKDGGLVDGWVKDNGVDGYSSEISRLTWRGHEFLDAIRDDGIWEKVKTHFKEKGVGMTIDAIYTVAGNMLSAIVNG